jgi:hypothetical protein
MTNRARTVTGLTPHEGARLIADLLARDVPQVAVCSGPLWQVSWIEPASPEPAAEPPKAA